MGRVVLVHGFTQTRRSWSRVLEELSPDYEVSTVDLPGHSGTPPLDLVDGARELARRQRMEGRGPSVYVGYSMGGRLCLHLVLQEPSLVRALVLVGTSPGIDDPTERSRRRCSDELLAARLEVEGVEAFLLDWLAQPMFARLPYRAADLADRASNSAKGLAGALRLAGTGAQEPLWDRLGDLATSGIPVLLLAGELDAKFKALARRTATAIGPTAQVAWIPGAGHAAHLEQPEAFLSLLRPFLVKHA